MTFYTKLPDCDVIRSKIDVFTLYEEYENKTHRVELTVDNEGVFIVACGGATTATREALSIEHKDLAIALARGILEAYEVV